MNRDRRAGRGNPRSARRSAWIKALLGLAVAAMIIVFVMRRLDYGQLGAIAGHIRWSFAAAGLLAYTAAIISRAVRWRMLLRRAVILPVATVSAALVIGFAANNLLPAKLGELVRADFLSRQCSIGRASVLGSIVLERLQDGGAVLALLLFGSIAAPERLPEAIRSVALWGSVPVAGLLIATVTASRLDLFFLLRRWPALAARYRDFHQALAGLWSIDFGAAALIAVLIWSFDLLSLWLVLKSVGVGLDVSGLALLTGTYSLASLLPTAPGYLGTYQLAFALVLAVYGFSLEQAIAGAFAVQLFLLAPLTVTGGILYLARMKWSPAGNA